MNDEWSLTGDGEKYPTDISPSSPYFLKGQLFSPTMEQDDDEDDPFDRSERKRMAWISESEEADALVRGDNQINVPQLYIKAAIDTHRRSCQTSADCIVCQYTGQKVESWSSSHR